MKWRKGKPSDKRTVIGYKEPPMGFATLCYYDKDEDKWFYDGDDDIDTRDEIIEPDYWTETP